MFICLMIESFLMLIATFQPQYCQSSSGDVNYLCVTICSTLVHCYWGISILIIISVARWCSLIGLYRSAVVLFDHVVSFDCDQFWKVKLVSVVTL